MQMNEVRESSKNLVCATNLKFGQINKFYCGFTLCKFSKNLFSPRKYLILFKSRIHNCNYFVEHGRLNIES